LAAVLKSRAGVDVELQPGGRGDFEVTIDGRKIFSKKALDRFPTEDEILTQVQ
jgi:selT/selW/selH-like putative selenoprotein